jgi:hypothetical protein
VLGYRLHGGYVFQSVDQVSNPRIILLDIETSPNLGYTWGKWQQNIIAFKKEWELLSFAWKVFGEKTTYCVGRLNVDSEYDLVKLAWGVLDEADIIIGHNIDQFDNKKLKAKFIEHGLQPPKPYKTVDTKKIAKSQFAFNGNSLNDLAYTLKLGKKAPTGGFDLWLGCMDNDPKSWAKMIAYNKHDVVLLEKVYTLLKTWYPNHPNLTLYSKNPGCPVCMSHKVQSRGNQPLKKKVAKRYQCQECYHWFKGKAVSLEGAL